MDKAELRSWAKNVRKGLEMPSVSKNLINELIKTEEYKKAQHIMIFYPLKDEVNLLPLLENKTKQFYLPKVNEQELLCCPYAIGDNIYLSCFGTKEPTTEGVNPEILDLVMVPALCCDRKNYRLGYGGGYYDRFLKGINAHKVVCLPKELLVETICPEEFDVPVDKVITA